jgi:hypothetical protein
VGSINYPAVQAAGLANGTDPYVARDDTDLATSHAEQMRDKTEFPPLAGSNTLDYISFVYNVGDQISVIQGRNVSLQTNVGSNQGETPTYPWIVGKSWHFAGERQTTVLTLSDKRTDLRRTNAW